MKRTVIALGTLALAGALALGGEEAATGTAMKPETYREISGKLEEIKTNPRKAKAALAAVGKLVDSHRAELLAALAGGSALERALAAKVLHLSSGEQEKVAEALSAALKDKDLEVRRGAAAGLAKMKLPATAGALIAALEDVDEIVRAAAAGALGQVKAAEAVEALAKALEDENWRVRLNACKALGVIAEGDKEKGTEIAGKLKPLLEDENAYVRMAAAATVQKLAGVKPDAAPRAGGKGDENILHELAKEMGDVRDDIEAEHHGREVIVAQEGIAKKLDQLIEMIKKQQQQQQQGQGQGKGKGKKKKGQGKGKGSKPGNQAGKSGQQGGQNPSSPMQGEFMTSGSVQHGDKATLGEIGAKWGKLPPKEREKMLEALRAQLPPRYTRMLEVYLRSLSEEAGR